MKKEPIITFDELLKEAEKLRFKTLKHSFSKELLDFIETCRTDKGYGIVSYDKIVILLKKRNIRTSASTIRRIYIDYKLRKKGTCKKK